MITTGRRRCQRRRHTKRGQPTIERGATALGHVDEYERVVQGPKGRRRHHHGGRPPGTVVCAENTCRIHHRQGRVLMRELPCWSIGLQWPSSIEARRSEAPCEHAGCRLVQAHVDGARVAPRVHLRVRENGCTGLGVRGRLQWPSRRLKRQHVSLGEWRRRPLQHALK